MIASLKANFKIGETFDIQPTYTNHDMLVKIFCLLSYFYASYRHKNTEEAVDIYLSYLFVNDNWFTTL